MDLEKLNKDLLGLLKEFVVENEIKGVNTSDIGIETRLIGSKSFFDSMELVSYTVEVEQFLEEEYNLEIELATEKAMSRRTSPFISVLTLSRYIKELDDE